METIADRLQRRSQSSDVADAGLVEGIIPFQQKQASFQSVLRPTNVHGDPNSGTLLQFLSVPETARAMLDLDALDESRV